MVKNLKFIFGAFAINVVSAILTMMIPYITGKLFDKLIVKPNMEVIYEFCKYLLGVTALNLVLGYVGTILSTKIRTKMSYEVNYEMLNHIQRVSLKKTSEFNPAYVNHRINSDVNTVISFILEIITNSTIHVIKLVILITYFMKVNFKLAIIVLLLDLFYLFVFLLLKGKMEVVKNKLKESGNRYYLYLQEQIANIKFIKVFSLQEFFYKKLTRGYKELYGNLRSDVRVNFGLKSSETTVQMLSQMAIFIIGGVSLINKSMTVGVFTVLMSYLQMIISCTNYCVGVGNVYVDAKIAYTRLKEYETMPVVNEGSGMIECIEAVELDAVSFGYTGELISNFSYKFLRGTAYAICGDNGKGKTTLLDLIAGLYQGQYDGCIYVNGVDMDVLDTDKLRNGLIGYCMQKTEVLEGDALFNVLVGRESYDKEYLKYLIQGFQLEYLFEKELDGKSLSAENVSGGEAQKISIIRTLISSTSDVYIFDEPTNNLDKKAQDFFVDIVKKLKVRAIVIIATHDRMLLGQCDERIDII